MSTLLLLRSFSSSSIPGRTGGLVVFTTAQAVAFLTLSSHPPTSPTTSPKGISSSAFKLPELLGRKPPGLRARGIGDINNESAGMKFVIDARRAWVGVVMVKCGEVVPGV